MTTQASAESTHRPRTQNASLAADRARIAAIEAQILELKRLLSSLKEESDLLQDRLDAYTYPVFTLPNEIVSEIFIHFLPVYPATPPIIGRSSPSVLGQICRKWRDIALGTPALWRGFTLSLRNGRRLNQKLRLLKVWLQRSGACLLSIDMDVEDDDRRLGISVVAPFTREIAAHSARWEYLRLYSPTRPFPFISAPLPFLRSLTVGPMEPVVDGAPNSDSLMQALHAAPLLQNVAVVFWRAHCTSLYPWSQLTAFTAHSILPHLCVDIWARAHNLTYCNMFVYAHEEESGDEVTRPSQNVTQQSLSTVILRGDLPDDLPWNFLDILTFPALRKLEIGEFLLQQDPIGLLQSFVSRSRCSLQELYLNASDLDIESYRVALPTVGSIVSGELDPVNPWGVPRDEENRSPRIADGDE
ncbi:hypothetical protein B0H16DRAFT_380985 [Mycena metata]|uniref:F-box domain-containing protein n=1 Tax=Mycena metata TaxID=1033252 RepID=A0AAD7HHL2_9AGAR|nr:hypothetical protein B0H16DRAFT_380985 [Mycena metata]